MTRTGARTTSPSCPRCGGALSVDANCPSCGVNMSELVAELSEASEYLRLTSIAVAGGALLSAAYLIPTGLLGDAAPWMGLFWAASGAIAGLLWLWADDVKP